jgi:hypothetical protein
MRCRSAAALTALALLAAACDSASGPSVADPRTRTASGEVRTVLPTWISGLRVVQGSSGHGRCKRTAGYPSVPGAEALTRRLRTAVDGFSVCGVDVSFDFLVASGDVVGVQTASEDRTAAASGMALATYWYDGRRRKVVPALDMIRPSAMGRYVKLVEEKLTGRAGADPAAAHAALDDPAVRGATLDNLAFAENGSLVAIFDQGEVATVPAGRQQVVVPRAEVGPMLSQFGRRVQRQAMHPGHSLRLGGGGAG